MRYLIDGYNLLFRKPGRKATFEQKRIHLIEELIAIAIDHHLNITVVFDGKIDDLPPAIPHWHKGISLVYTTSGQSADDYLLEETFSSSHPEQITVVSSDQELTKKCRLHGAKSLQVREFLQRFTLTDKSHTEQTHHFRESPAQVERLRAIFEERWQKILEEEKKRSDK